MPHSYNTGNLSSTRTNYLQTGRTNIGKEPTPNSMVVDGDIPTKIVGQLDIRPYELEVMQYPDGDLYDGISFTKDLFSKHHGLTGENLYAENSSIRSY